MSLPKNVKAAIKASAHFAHVELMSSVRQNVASVGNIVRHSAAKQVDEIGPATAAAVAKILALP